MFIGNITLFNRWVNHFYIIIWYSPKSFDDLDSWLKDLKDNANPDIKIYLIGNKIDLEESRLINIEEGKKLQEDYNIDLFKETCIKEENNAQEIFVEAAKLLYGDYSKNMKDNKQKDCGIF